MNNEKWLDYYRDSYNGIYDVGGLEPLDDFNFLMFLFDDKPDSKGDFTYDFIKSLGTEAP